MKKILNNIILKIIDFYYQAISVFCSETNKKPTHLNLKPHHQIKDEKINFLTYNIQDLPFPLRKNQRDEFVYIAQKIREKDYDIIAFQEGFTSETQKYISKYYKYRHIVYPVKNCPKILNNGLWIFSKYKINYAKNYPFNHRIVGYDILADKSLLHVNLQLNNKTSIHVINTHLNSLYSSGVSSKTVEDAQNKQLVLLKVILNNIPIEEKVIVCGDFNIDPNKNTFKNFMEATNLKRSFGYNNIIQGHLSENDFDKLKERPERSYILYRGENITLEHSDIEFQMFENGIQPSNHYGLLATFEI